MKGIILAAGLGSRLKPFSHGRPKHILPVGNKPIISHIIESISKTGVKEIAIVVSQSNIDHIKKVCGNIEGVQFILQENQLGTGDAVKSAMEFLGQDDAIIYLGDNLFEDNLAILIQKLYDSPDTLGAVGLHKVDNPSSFGVAEISGDRVIGITEKPKDFISDLAVMGVFIAKNELLKEIYNLNLSPRGEYELTEIFCNAISSNKLIRYVIFNGWWNDAGTPSSLLQANANILRSITKNVEGELFNSEVIGEVCIEEGASIHNSRLIGPCHIASGVSINDCRVGPNVSIGRNSSLRHVCIENAILDIDSSINFNDLKFSIKDSVLGIAVSLTSLDSSNCENNDPPKRLELMLGDNSSVKI